MFDVTRRARRIKKLLRGDVKVTLQEADAYERWKAGITREKPLVVRIADELGIPEGDMVQAVRESRTSEAVER